MPNKYVNFVSDRDFLFCIKHVCTAYQIASQDNLDFQRNVIDPFKMVFDLLNTGSSLSQWIVDEQMRQKDKTINNAIGEFHQMLLGKVTGWTDLGRGNESKVDLMKTDKSIFIELKNKHNTMNSGSSDSVRKKLEKISQEHPKAIVYWGYIIGKGGKSGDEVWIIRGQDANNRIRKIWGKKVYELVTGDPDALEKVWLALPSAVNDYLGASKKSISIKEMNNMKKYFSRSFKD